MLIAIEHLAPRGGGGKAEGFADGECTNHCEPSYRWGQG
jgi:hypothetical protein